MLYTYGKYPIGVRLENRSRRRPKKPPTALFEPNVLDKRNSRMQHQWLYPERNPRKWSGPGNHAHVENARSSTPSMFKSKKARRRRRRVANGSVDRHVSRVLVSDRALSGLVSRDSGRRTGSRIACPAGLLDEACLLAAVLLMTH